MALFGTNGVRGKLDLLPPSLAFRLSASFCSFCKGGRICLARDMRLTSPMLHSAALSGILSSGSDALDLGLCSSPVAEFALLKYGGSGLIIVTASHNAPEWNALKFVDGNGVAISRERGGAIEGMALLGKGGKQAMPRPGKEIPSPDAAKRHASSVLSFVDSEKIRKKRLRLVLDFGNGTSSLSRLAFEQLGCEIIPLNEKIDGMFPGRPSEPSEANVQGLCKKVRQESADFGVAWDGDSDRVVFADEAGKWVVGDKGFAVSALQACKEQKAQKEKYVVTTVATSRAVEEACAKHGAKTIYTAVGAPYLSEKVFELGGKAVSGGEEVGGIIWPRFGLAKDGILAAAKVAEMACESPLSLLVRELPEYYNSKTKVEAAGAAAKGNALSKARRYAQQSNGRLTSVDGVRVDFEDSWAIVRASGTENYIRIFAEAKTQKRADALMAEYREIAEHGMHG